MKTRPLLSALAFTLACALLLAGCDSSGPETELPDPSFEATLSGARTAQLEGTAALGADFGPGAFFTFQLPPTFPLLGGTITAIQLRDTEETVMHQISLIYFGEDQLAPGTYDANPDLDPSIFEECRDAENPPACIREAIGPRFFTSYTRRTADSLYSYSIGLAFTFSEGQTTPVSSGQIIIDTSTEDLVEGSFHLEASSVSAVALQELEAFQEAMRGWNGNWEDLPPFPDYNFRRLAPALTIEGTFTATAADLPPLGP